MEDANRGIASCAEMRPEVEVHGEEVRDLSGNSHSHLSLSSLKLREVPSHVLQTKTLRSLNLSRNAFEYLPPEIGEMISLTELDVSRNSLRCLPTELGQLTQLRVINVLSNRLNHRTLPLECLASLPDLRLLDLRFNPKCKSLEAVSRFFDPSRQVELRVTQEKGPRDPAIVGDHACDRDATQLRSQLEPWSTPTLRRRLCEIFGIETDPEQTSRGDVMTRLLECYNAEGPRAIRIVQPKAVCPPAMYEALLEQFQIWVSQQICERERPTIAATGYMILRAPAEFSKQDGQKARLAAAKIVRHQKMWDLAAAIIAETDPEFSVKYTAIAFTHNFVGSPHIDLQNNAPFYALGLGDYTGGELCVESSPREVSYCKTHGRLAKVDGRFPHWVAPYEGTRYSVIYYQTIGEVEPMGPAVYL